MKAEIEDLENRIRHTESQKPVTKGNEIAIMKALVKVMEKLAELEEQIENLPRTGIRI